MDISNRIDVRKTVKERIAEAKAKRAKARQIGLPKIKPGKKRIAS